MTSPETMPPSTVGDADRWMQTHDAFVHESQNQEPDVLFIGDGLVALLEQSEVYLDLFSPLHCLCFGILGDTSEHVLWRVNNGELDGAHPKVIVVSAGSCDRGQPTTTASNVQQVVHRIRQRHHTAHIIVLKLLPSGRTKNPHREFAKAVNELLEDQLSEATDVTIANCDPGFASTTDGSIDRHDMFDFFHLSKDGYRKAFDLVYTEVLSALNPDSE